MKIDTINTVTQFHEMVKSYDAAHPIFRGVQNSSYELLSRVGRSIIENKKKRENSVTDYIVGYKTEISSLDRFKRHAAPYIQNPPENNWEWLAIAQHYGLPTRLMDWTRNPLVAAYFSCKDNRNANDAAIFVLDEYDIDSVNSEDQPFEITMVKVFTQRHTTQRIAAQSALFTVHPDPHIPFDHDGLHKWIINTECIFDIEIMAETYGIDDASMFPGLDGIAKSTAKTFGLL